MGGVEGRGVGKVETAVLEQQLKTEGKSIHSILGECIFLACLLEINYQIYWKKKDTKL